MCIGMYGQAAVEDRHGCIQRKGERVIIIFIFIYTNIHIHVYGDVWARLPLKIVMAAQGTQRGRCYTNMHIYTQRSYTKKYAEIMR